MTKNSSRRDLQPWFEEQGYVVIEDLLTPQEISSSAAEILRLHRVAGSLPDDNPSASDFQREPHVGTAGDHDIAVLRKIENTDRYSEHFRQLACHEALLSVVRPLLGDDLLLYRSTLMLKPAFHGSPHALHQDSYYWPIDPPTLATVSIALSDASTENGCFQVIPGSHKWGLRDWGNIIVNQDADIADGSGVDASELIELPLRAGSAVFFHSLLVHGSGPNRSPRARNTALYAYFPPTVRLQHETGRKEASYRVICGMDGQRSVTI